MKLAKKCVLVSGLVVSALLPSLGFSALTNRDESMREINELMKQESFRDLVRPEYKVQSIQLNNSVMKVVAQKTEQRKMCGMWMDFVVDECSMDVGMEKLHTPRLGTPTLKFTFPTEMTCSAQAVVTERAEACDESHSDL